MTSLGLNAHRSCTDNPSTAFLYKIVQRVPFVAPKSSCRVRPWGASTFRLTLPLGGCDAYLPDHRDKLSTLIHLNHPLPPLNISSSPLDTRSDR